MSTLTELSAFAATSGLGAVGTTLFEGEIPEAMDEAAGITESPGNQLDRALGRPPLESTSFQFLVRSATLAGARSKAFAALLAYETVANRTLGSTRYLRIEAIGTPGFIGRDGKSRAMFSVNFNVLKEWSA